MERLIATHKAQGVDGTIYTVFEFQEFVDATSHEGRAAIPGMKRLELDSGSVVSPGDSSGDTFRIINTGEIIRKVS